MADNDNHTRLFPGLARQAQKAAAPEPSGKPGNVIPLRPLPEDPGPGPHTWSDDGGRRRGRARRIVLLAVLALLLAAAVAAVIWGSAADLDARDRRSAARVDARKARHTRHPPAKRTCRGRARALRGRRLSR